MFRLRLLIIITLSVLVSTFANGQELDSDSIAIPEFVAQLALAHFDSLTARPEDEAATRLDFSSRFLFGYTSGVSVPICDGENSELAGFNAGIEYRKRNPKSTDRVLTAFGYTRTIAVGTWRTGSEISLFVRSEKPQTHDDRWWVSMIDGATEHDIRWKRVPKLSPDRKIPDEIRRIIDEGRGREASAKISGYLSPNGAYGHMGEYTREFVANEVFGVGDSPDGDTSKTPLRAAKGYRSYHGQPYPTENTNEPLHAPKDTSRTVWP